MVANSDSRLVWFLKYHLPAIAFAALIIAVSSIRNLSTPQVSWFAADKLAHFIEYSLLALLVYRSFSHWGDQRRYTRSYLLTLLCVSVFGALDEYYQSYVPGRQMAAGDYLMDVAGALLVATFLWLRQRRLRSQNRP